MTGGAGNIIRTLDAAAAAAAAFLLSILFALVLLQVVSRWSAFSIPQTEELTRYTLAVLSAFALYPFRDDAPPSKPQRPRLNLAARILVAGPILYGAVELARLGLDQDLSTLKISIAWIYAAVAVPIAASVAACLLRFGDTE